MTRGCHPCLVCGNEAAGPKSGVVCIACRDKVRDYDRLRAKIEHSEDIVSIQIRTWPGVPAGGLRSQCRDQLHNLLMGLRDALGGRVQRYSAYDSSTTGIHAPKYGDKPHKRYSGTDTEDRSVFNVPKPLAQFFIDLEPAIIAALEEACENGRERGSNLLVQLAAGELTSGDFERQAGIAPKRRSDRAPHMEEE